MLRSHLVTAAAFIAAATLQASAASAAITYGFDVTATTAYPTGNPLQSDSVTGSLTTDGTIGVLHAANILDWTLSLVDHLDATQNYTLTKANSLLLEDGGGALSATATALLFNYSGAGEFLIQAKTPGPYSGSRYFCFSAAGGACLPGETISPGYATSDGVVLTGDSAPIGSQSLTPPSLPGGVPEPATWAMMLVGFGGVGMALRDTRRRSKAALA